MGGNTAIGARAPSAEGAACSPSVSIRATSGAAAAAACATPFLVTLGIVAVCLVSLWLLALSAPAACRGPNSSDPGNFCLCEIQVPDKLVPDLLLQPSLR